MSEIYYTPAQKLFYTKFYIHIQNRAFYSAYELEEIGFVSCGNDKDNEAYLNDFRLVHVPVPQIAEWNAKGESIKLVNLLDATPMFHLINDHLESWLKVAQISPYAKFPPLEDIEALDDMAELLYPLVDVNPELFDDPILMLMFGNAIDFSYTIPGNETKEPYERYTPKIFPYTQPRWAR